MNNEKTTCPCCGAPAICTEKEVLVPPFEGNLRGWGYKYEPTATSIMDYDVRHLRIVAELLNAHNFTPQDLREIEHNLETALTIARAEYEKTLQRMLDEALKPLQAPHVEPWSVSLPNCADYVEEALEKAAKRPHTKAEVGGV